MPHIRDSGVSIAEVRVCVQKPGYTSSQAHDPAGTSKPQPIVWTLNHVPVHSEIDGVHILGLDDSLAAGNSVAAFFKVQIARERLPQAMLDNSYPGEAVYDAIKTLLECLCPCCEPHFRASAHGSKIRVLASPTTTVFNGFAIDGTPSLLNTTSQLVFCCTCECGNVVIFAAPSEQFRSMDLPSPSIIFRVGFCLPRVEHVIVNLDVSSTKAELCQQTALLQAVARGNTAQTTFILNCYPEEVNSPDSNGFTPIRLAVHMGHKSMVEILLAHGAQPDAKSVFGSSALDDAIRCQKLELLEVLLQELSVTRSLVEVMMVSAVKANSRTILEFLLDKYPGPFDFHHPVTKRNLAHQAAMVGSLDILSALSERDKTVFQTLLAQPDSTNMKPWELAKDGGHADALRALDLTELHTTNPQAGVEISYVLALAVVPTDFGQICSLRPEEKTLLTIKLAKSPSAVQSLSQISEFEDSAARVIVLETCGTSRKDVPHHLIVSGPISNDTSKSQPMRMSVSLQKHNNQPVWLLLAKEASPSRQEAAGSMHTPVEAAGKKTYLAKISDAVSGALKGAFTGNSFSSRTTSTKWALLEKILPILLADILRDYNVSPNVSLSNVFAVKDLLREPADLPLWQSFLSDATLVQRNLVPLAAEGSVHKRLYLSGLSLLLEPQSLHAGAPPLCLQLLSPEGYTRTETLLITALEQMYPKRNEAVFLEMWQRAFRWACQEKKSAEWDAAMGHLVDTASQSAILAIPTGDLKFHGQMTAQLLHDLDHLRQCVVCSGPCFRPAQHLPVFWARALVRVQRALQFDTALTSDATLGFTRMSFGVDESTFKILLDVYPIYTQQAALDFQGLTSYCDLVMEATCAVARPLLDEAFGLFLTNVFQLCAGHPSWHQVVFLAFYHSQLQCAPAVFPTLNNAPNTDGSQAIFLRMLKYLLYGHTCSVPPMTPYLSTLGSPAMLGLLTLAVGYTARHAPLPDLKRAELLLEQVIPLRSSISALYDILRLCRLCRMEVGCLLKECHTVIQKAQEKGCEALQYTLRQYLDSNAVLYHDKDLFTALCLDRDRSALDCKSLPQSDLSTSLLKRIVEQLESQVNECLSNPSALIVEQWPLCHVFPDRQSMLMQLIQLEPSDTELLLRLPWNTIRRKINTVQTHILPLYEGLGETCPDLLRNAKEHTLLNHISDIIRASSFCAIVTGSGFYATEAAQLFSNKDQMAQIFQLLQKCIVLSEQHLEFFRRLRDSASRLVWMLVGQALETQLVSIHDLAEQTNSWTQFQDKLDVGAAHVVHILDNRLLDFFYLNLYTVGDIVLLQQLFRLPPSQSLPEELDHFGCNAKMHFYVTTFLIGVAACLPLEETKERETYTSLFGAALIDLLASRETSDLVTEWIRSSGRDYESRPVAQDHWWNCVSQIELNLAQPHASLTISSSLRRMVNTIVDPCTVFALKDAQGLLSILVNEALLTQQREWCRKHISQDRFRDQFMFAAGQAVVSQQTASLGLCASLYKFLHPIYDEYSETFPIEHLCQHIYRHSFLLESITTIANSTAARLLEIDRGISEKQQQLGTLAHRQIQRVLHALSAQESGNYVIYQARRSAENVLSCSFVLYKGSDFFFSREEMDNQLIILRNAGETFSLDTFSDAEQVFGKLEEVARLCQRLIDLQAFGFCSERALLPALKFHPLSNLAKLASRLALYAQVWQLKVAMYFCQYLANPLWLAAICTGHAHLVRLGIKQIAQMERAVARLPQDDKQLAPLESFCDSSSLVMRDMEHNDEQARRSIITCLLAELSDLESVREQLETCLVEKFEYLAWLLSQNCHRLGLALPSCLALKIETQNLVSSGSVVMSQCGGISLLNVAQLWENYHGANAVFAALMCGLAYVTWQQETGGDGAVWPTRYDIFSCLPPTAFDADAFRRFLCAFLMEQEDERAPSPAFVILPDLLSVASQALMADVLSSVSPAFMKKQSCSLVFVLGAVNAVSERLHFVLKLHLSARIYQTHSPKREDLAAQLCALQLQRDICVVAVTNSANYRGNFGGATRSGKSFNIQTNFEGHPLSLKQQARPLLLVGSTGIDTFLRHFDTHHGSKIWIEVSAALDGTMVDPGSVHLIDEIFLQLLCFGVVRVKDSFRRWLLHGRTEFVVEVHVDTEEQLKSHIPLFSLLSNEAGYGHVPSLQVPGINLHQLPHVLPEQDCKNCCWVDNITHFVPEAPTYLEDNVDIPLVFKHRMGRFGHWLFHQERPAREAEDVPGFWSTCLALFGTPMVQIHSAFVRHWLLSENMGQDAPLAWQNLNQLQVPSVVKMLRGEWPPLVPLVRVMLTDANEQLPADVALLVAGMQRMPNLVDHHHVLLLKTLVTTVEQIFGNGVAAYIMKRHPGFVLSPLVLIRLIFLAINFCLNLPLILEGDTGVGKTKLLEVFCDMIRFAQSQFDPTNTECLQLKVLDMQPSETMTSVTTWLEVNAPASKEETGISNHCGQLPSSIVFVDEINCASIGILEVMRTLLLDRRLTVASGRLRLGASVWLVAACNPYRAPTTKGLASYAVRPLSSALQSICWPLDAMEQTDLEFIVAARLATWPRLAGVQVQAFQVAAQVMLQGHQVATHFAQESWHAGIGAPAVSLRDVDRTLAVADLLMGDRLRVLNGVQQCQKALQVAVAVVYLARINASNRAASIGDRPLLVEAVYLLQSSAIVLSRALRLDSNPSVFVTEGLRELLLVLFVHALAKIPLFILGPAGTSKSFALTVFVQAMRDADLRAESECLRGLPAFNLGVLQCSPELTAEALSSEFDRAADYIRHVDAAEESVIVVLEEVGLAYAAGSVPSLKVLHHLLDRQLQLPPITRVAFVALSNTFIDAAKMNRGTVLQRETMGRAELLAMTQRVLISNKVPISAAVHEFFVDLFEEITTAMTIGGSAAPWAPYASMFGSRDYFSFLQSAARCLGMSTQQAVYTQLLASFVDQFSGVPALHGHVRHRFVTKFIQVFDVSSEQKWRRLNAHPEINGVDLLSAHLSGTSPAGELTGLDTSSVGTAKDTVDMRLGWALQDRHLLCLTPLPLLGFWVHLMMGIKRVRLQDAELPSISGDQSLDQDGVVGDIVNCMRQGQSTVMMANVGAYNCLLDVINGHAVQTDSHAGTRKARVASHGRSKYVSVDTKFALVIVDSEAHARKWPIPLLHRLRKVVLPVDAFKKRCYEHMDSFFGSSTAAESEAHIWPDLSKDLQEHRLHQLVNLDTLELAIQWETLYAKADEKFDETVQDVDWREHCRAMVKSHCLASKPLQTWPEFCRRVTAKPCTTAVSWASLHCALVLARPRFDSMHEAQQSTLLQPLLDGVNFQENPGHTSDLDHRQAGAGLQNASVVIVCRPGKNFMEMTLGSKVDLGLRTVFVVPASMVTLHMTGSHPEMKELLDKLILGIFAGQEFGMPTPWLILEIDGLTVPPEVVNDVLGWLWERVYWDLNSADEHGRIHVILLFCKTLDVTFGSTTIHPSPLWRFSLISDLEVTPHLLLQKTQCLPESTQGLLRRRLALRLHEMSALLTLCELCRWDPGTREVLVPTKNLSERLINMVLSSFNRAPLLRHGVLEIQHAHLESLDVELLDENTILATKCEAQVYKSQPLPQALAPLALRLMHQRLQSVELQLALEEIGTHSRAALVTATIPPMWPQELRKNVVQNLCELQDFCCSWRPVDAALDVLTTNSTFASLKSAAGFGRVYAETLSEFCSLGFYCLLVRGQHWWTLSGPTQTLQETCKKALETLHSFALPCIKELQLTNLLREQLNCRELETIFGTLADVQRQVADLFEATPLVTKGTVTLNQQNGVLKVAAPTYLIDVVAADVRAHLVAQANKILFAVKFFPTRLRLQLVSQYQAPPAALTALTNIRVEDVLLSLPTVRVATDTSLPVNLISQAQCCAGLYFWQQAALRGPLIAGAQAMRHRLHTVYQQIMRQLGFSLKLLPKDDEDDAAEVRIDHQGKPMFFRERPLSRENVVCLFFMCGEQVVLDDASHYIQQAEAYMDKSFCGICMCAHDANIGIFCDNELDPHYMCNDCFNELVRSAADLTEGHAKAITVLCPMKKMNQCANSKPFSDQTIAAHCKPEVHIEVLAAHKILLEVEMRKSMEKEYQDQLKHEIERLKTLSAQELEIEQRHAHVVAEILTLRCTRCRQAFIDFNGCFALTCSSCSCGFCALCLKDCGTDAHSHVASCFYGRTNGGYFGTLEQFHEVHRQRKERELGAYLSQIADVELYNKVVKRLRVEAADLKLALPALR